MTTFWGVSSSCSHDWHTKVSASVPGLRERVREETDSPVGVTASASRSVSQISTSLSRVLNFTGKNDRTDWFGSRD